MISSDYYISNRRFNEVKKDFERVGLTSGKNILDRTKYRIQIDKFRGFTKNMDGGKETGLRRTNVAIWVSIAKRVARHTLGGKSCV